MTEENRMEIERRIEKARKLWEKNSGRVHMILAREKSLMTEGETILLELITMAARYNITSTALFVVHNMAGASAYKEIVLRAIEEQMGQLQKDGRDIAGYTSVVVALWRALVLIWDEDNSESIQMLLSKLYHHYMGDKEQLPDRSIVSRDYKFSNKILTSAEEETGVYPMSDVYIRSVYMFSRLMDKENLGRIEIYQKQFVYGTKINAFSKKIVNDYIEALLADENYVALSSFLHKTADMDFEEICGQTKEVFWNRLISTQSERLADCCLRMTGKTDADYLDAWKAKVEALVQKPVTLAWCDWAYYWHYLVDLLEEEMLAEEVFQQKAREMMPACDFPFEEVGTYNRITKAVIYIFSEAWERKWNPFFLVDLWKENNLFSYNKRSVYHRSPLYFQNPDKAHNWSVHQKTFWAWECTEEERIRLYMNSPIRCAIDFYDTMVEFARRMGKDKFVETFREYLLEGNMVNVDTQMAAGYLRFEIGYYFHCEHRYGETDQNDKDKIFYNALLLNSEEWYNKNERLAKRIAKSLDVPCSFRLCSCDWTGDNDAILYVDTISSDQLMTVEELREIQKNEMLEALEWMGQIREQRQVIPVGKKDFQNLIEPHHIRMSQQFAEAIFDTMLTLQNTPSEAFHFLSIIDERKMDKINAFQYILTQNWLTKFRVEGGFGTVWKRFNALCKDVHFTKCQKVNIYMNTYLKSFCGLSELWTRLQLQENDMTNLLASNNEYDKFLFLVEFVKMEAGTAFFTLHKDIKIQIGGKDEIYHWALRNAELTEEQIGNSFRVSVRDIDTQAKILWIGEIHEQKIVDRWRLTANRMNDLKDNSSLTHIAKIRKDVEKWGMEFNTKKRLEQLLIKFVGLFSLIEKPEYPKEYNLFWCKNILDVFGDRNPFMEPMERSLKISDSELKRMRDGIPDFMQAAYERSAVKGEAFVGEMMEFYECSPYRLICERDAFEAMLAQVLDSAV